MTVSEDSGVNRSGEFESGWDASAEGSVIHPTPSVYPSVSRSTERERVTRAEIERRPWPPDGRL